ncbi:protein MODIFIED TRANSPORT TO THE VACUOLE 1-like [Apium graveolens]|uniref:protein MODIFIED TRANSPORT TO THE VACUOLE 1-like n=1 Tax=Apium graveolens TaxID=4045 RepID=UPI003D7B66FA
MDQSRRAVESYWRSRLIDGVTSDEDKVAPVYKLDEICELLRSSHVSIVKELSQFLFNRLDHKSPIVKQKALRLIKYSVGKSGVEFRRELQRNSVAIRQLIHYKGHPDPLKGDALNKSVRVTAQEALSVLFSTDDNKPAPSDDLTQRIQGFGSTNYEMPSEDKKSFLSDVVGFGSATIKQGLNSLSQAPAEKRKETGSYRGPNLRRSLTTDVDYSDHYEGVEHQTETQPASRISSNVSDGAWTQDLKTTTYTSNVGSSSSYSDNKTREDRLLDTIVTTGGVRLQPTRDALHLFIVEASKLDVLALCYALESKLQSHSWQVRVRAVCVLDAILRKKDDEHFSVVALYFSDNKDVVVKCCESPQASLREKANRVLGLLEGKQPGNVVGVQENQVKAETTAIQMPDLIDTGDSDDLTHQSPEVLTTPATPIIDDLFGDSQSTGFSTTEHDDDPFADVSFHTNNDKEHVDDIFSGMITDKTGAVEAHLTSNQNGAEIFDIFGPNSGPPGMQVNKDVNDLMSGLSITGEKEVNQQETSSKAFSPNILSASSANLNTQGTNDTISKIYGAQTAGINANHMFPVGTVPYNLPPGVMYNPAYPSQPINYAAMQNLLAQQQFLATMSNYQQLGNLHPQNFGFNQAAETQGGVYSSALPDVFNSGLPTQNPTSVMSGPKKEETRAFDFISDHLAAVRDPKRVI